MWSHDYLLEGTCTTTKTTTFVAVGEKEERNPPADAPELGHGRRWGGRVPLECTAAETTCSRAKHDTRAKLCTRTMCSRNANRACSVVFTNTIRNSCIDLKPQTESDQILDLEEKDLRSADQSWLPTPAAALSEREMYGRSRWTNHRRCYSDVGTSVKSVCGPKLSASRGSSVRGGGVWKTDIDVTTTADTADIFSMQNANVRSDKSKLD